MSSQSNDPSPANPMTPTHNHFMLVLICPLRTEGRQFWKSLFFIESLCSCVCRYFHNLCDKMILAFKSFIFIFVQTFQQSMCFCADNSTICVFVQTFPQSVLFRAEFSAIYAFVQTFDAIFMVSVWFHRHLPRPAFLCRHFCDLCFWVHFHNLS